MQKLRSGVSVGQRVEARGEPWLVVQSEAFSDCGLVTLRGAGEDNHGRIARLLTPFDRLTPTHTSSRVRRAGRHTVLRAAARAVARGHEWLEPWSTTSARIDLLSWQLEPALAAVSGATRLLLTDEVGLGKTIQAGLILAELRARGIVSRALILTPASLREQWSNELADRFALDPQVLDHAELTSLAVRLPVGVNPWSTAELMISSIDLVKRSEVRAALDAVPLDLLIVDEAHHLTPGTERGAVVAELAARTPFVVLATATPHSGDHEAFAFLSRIGSCGSEQAPVVFRRRGADVGRHRSRRVHFHSVRANRDERVLLDETLAYATLLWRQADHPSSSRGAFVASVICRRAVSSSRALGRTLERRRALLSGAPLAPAHPELPWLEEEDADGAGSTLVLAASPLSDAAAEIACLDRLISLSGHVSRASKFDAVARVLARTEEPAIIFSEYRDTLIALEERLRDRLGVATLHGGLSARERREVILRFVDGDVRVLLATDAAGEGLNLQARCRLVINVELPWNPVRLEQRIGRVDRLGQQRRVHAIHLYHRRSFEEHVLARLQRRVTRAATDLDGLLFDEAAIAAAVFDAAPVADRTIPRQPLTAAPGRLPSIEAAHLRHRAARLAAHGGVRQRTRETAVCVGLPKARPLARAMALLFQWDVHDGAGRLVTRDVACVVVALAPAVSTRRGEVCLWTRRLAEWPAVRAALERTRAQRLRHVAVQTQATAAAIERRLASIDRTLRESTAAPFQGSLFDRRAEREAKASRAALEAARAHIGRQLSLARALRTVVSSHPPRLIAAWALPVE
jgi:superfamily II DNA or RNA helicase